MFSQPQALSDADGCFRFRYPQRAVGVDLTILPPGFAAQGRFLPSPLPESITVQVAQDGGTLILDLGSFQPDLPEGVLPPSLLLHGDARLSLASARTWARLQRAEAPTDGKLSIPMMAPGSYTLCVSSKTGEPNRCAQGSLLPHGELVLRGE